MGLPFRTRVPAVAAPMFLVSGPDLVIAAAKAGIVGCFPTPNARPIATLEAWMDRISGELADAAKANPTAIVGPWAANLITHSSNARLPEDLALVAKYEPPMIVTALGSPKPAVAVAKTYGGLVFADVIDVVFARKAIEAGADGLVLVCAGAGGHTGHMSPFAFLSEVRKFHAGPVILGGGIGDGAGMAGAIAAGADLVYLGTRFIAASESLASPEYKEMVARAGPNDILPSAAITGTTANWLKPSLVANGYDPANMPANPGRDYDTGTAGAKRWANIWSAGQGVGTVEGVEPVSAIVDRLEREYLLAMARVADLAAELRI